MNEVLSPIVGTPAEGIETLQRTPSLTAVMKSMITIPASGELSTPKSCQEVKTPKRSKAEIQREIAFLTGSENILGFRRPLRRKSSNSSLRSVTSVTSISSISSIASLSGGLSTIRNKLKGKLRRKRKMCEDEECGSSTKRKRHGSIGNIANMSAVIIPGRVKSATIITRTNSLRMVRSPTGEFIKPYTGPALTPSKVREYQVWQKTVDPFVLEHMPPALVRRQEAIYELLQGEKELVEDLNLVLKVFYGPMKQLGLISEEEMSLIFGNIEELIEVHQTIVNNLEALQNQIGVYDNIAPTVITWIPLLHCYSQYCSNQIYAKEVLDQAAQKPDVADFLERCRASSFSRKLDLWSFLDTPRRRLPKYVLLIKNIIKMTLPTHSDKMGLQRAIEGLHAVLAAVDKATGQAKCDKYKKRLVFLQDKHNSPAIQSASSLLCDGPLRNKNGTKLHGLLFDTVFLLTRQLQKETLHYQVYRTPILVCDIQVEDLAEVRMGGSFKRTFTTAGEISKNFFRVWEGETQGYLLSVQSGTKKQWIDSILNAKKSLRGKALVPRPTLPIPFPAPPVSVSTTTENDECIPTTPIQLVSPPVQFITPQAKYSRSTASIDYTPTFEGGKKVRSVKLGSLSAILGSPSAKLDTSSANLDTLSPILGSPSAKLDTLNAKLGSPCTKLDTSSTKLDTLSAKLGSPSAKLDISTAKLDTSSAKLGTPSAKLDTSSAKLDTPNAKLGSPSAEKGQENCATAANQMTPFSTNSPKLHLRTDDHVQRLVVDQPTSSPIFTKSSRV